MSEGLFTRVYLILMFANIGLIVFGGVHTYVNGVEWDATKIDPMKSSGVDILWGWITTAMDVMLMGGVIGMFKAAEMPIEIQYVIGVPLTALSIFATYPIIKGAVQAVAGVVGSLFGVLARLIP